jgi:nucleoside-diphosphate-sugar epimerase
MSHVVPDLIQKILAGQDPVHILGSGDQVRHYTYGGDLARGIVMSLEHPEATNNDFNMSTAVGHTVIELAEAIWKKIYGDLKPFNYILEPGFEYDVQKRVPATEKAKKILGFVAETELSTMLDEVIPWIKAASKAGLV